MLNALDLFEKKSQSTINLTKMKLYIGGGLVELCIFYLTPDVKTLEKILSLKEMESDELFNSDKLSEREKELDLKRHDALDAQTGQIIPAYFWAGGGGYLCSHYTNGEPSLLFGLAHSYSFHLEDEFAVYGLPDENGKLTRLGKVDEDIFKMRYDFYKNRREALNRVGNVEVYSLPAIALEAERRATDQLKLD